MYCPFCRHRSRALASAVNVVRSERSEHPMLIRTAVVPMQKVGNGCCNRHRLCYGGYRLAMGERWAANAA